MADVGEIQYTSLGSTVGQWLAEEASLWLAGGEPRLEVGRGSNVTPPQAGWAGPSHLYTLLLRELEDEWPEVRRVLDKLVREEELDWLDREWVEEIARASGWDVDDVAEELTCLWVDPSARAERYRELFENYLSEAVERRGRGRLEQAAEKLWGAITALLKLYASLKGVPIIQWSRGKLHKFVANNIEPEYRKLFMDLLVYGNTLHEYFYEGVPDPSTFDEMWEWAFKLATEARKVVYSLLQHRR